MIWYYEKNGKPEGPLSDVDLKQRVDAGEIGPNTLVWRPGLKDWIPFRAVPFHTSPPPGGEHRPADEEPRDRPEPTWVTPAEFRKMRRELGVTAPAGFWIRAAAKLLDGLIVTFSSYLLAFMTRSPLAVLVCLLILPVFYHTFFVGRMGATPGKLIFGLRVVCADGSPVSYTRALGRWCAEWLSGLFCGIGYLIAAFDSRKRALHDHLAGTRVLRQ